MKGIIQRSQWKRRTGQVWRKVGVPSKPSLGTAAAQHLVLFTNPEAL